MTRLVLLEHAPESFRPERDDVVVALTPEACYALDRQGVGYRLATDFGLDERIASLEPLHWQEQLAWLDALDDVVSSHVPATRRWRFGAATLYGYWLKTVMDPVRIRALELDSMLDACDRVLLHQPSLEEPGLTSLVLPLVAAARGIACEVLVDEDAPALEIPPTLGPPSREAGSATRLKAPLRKARREWHRARSALTGPRTTRLTLLFVDFGYDLTYLLTRAREQGHRCLRVVGDTVVEEGPRGLEVGRLPVEGEAADWVSAAEAVAAPDHPLWAWPNGWLTGAPLADVCRSHVLFWLSEVMPRIAARAAAFESLLRSENVDLVLGANIASPDVVAAAAVTAPPTQSVLIDHGHRAHASELFDLILLRHVDHNFCWTGELARYMELRRALYDVPTAEIHVGSYQLGATSTSRSGQPPQPLPDDRPVVVFALGATGGSRRYLNGPWFTDSWYYVLCREIVDILARHPEVFSVVKLFPGDGLARNPIDLYVDDLGLDHVVWSRAPLRDWIPWADRVVFDYPSTGLYEVAAAGVPYLALLYGHHRYRPAAVERLGLAAVQFTEPAEAARAVEAFVAAPTASAPRFAPEGEEILTALERVAGA